MINRDYRRLTGPANDFSHSILSTLFSIDRKQVGRAIAATRNGIMTPFVPHFASFDHISRDEVTQKDTRGIEKNTFCK